LQTFGLQSSSAVPKGNRDYTKLKDGPGSNEFATAVMRFGHSIVQGTISYAISRFILFFLFFLFFFYKF
jgi:hypothetical protein